jgi:hypothetical protein
MAFLGRQPATTGMANFKFSRRELTGKLFAIAGALLLPKPQPEALVTPTEVQSKPQPETPVTPTEVQPKFKIGDLVAYDWEPEDDDAPEFATDFGEVFGMRWVPEPDGYSSGTKTWVYFVRWTHSSCPGILLEPCYDGELTESSALRLVSVEERCKH